MSDNIQISKKFLTNVYGLILRLEAFELDFDTKCLCEEINAQIGQKIASMDKRRAFTEYKVAQGQEREVKRQEYLDRAGIHDNWRSSVETKNV